MNRVLICIDCQNDFITGVLGSEAANAAIPNVRALIDEFIENNEVIIFTMDTHNKDYLNTYEGKHLPIKHCIFPTTGWQLDERINIIEKYSKCRVIAKNNFGYPYWEDYNLKDYNEIIVCGFCSSICCMANIQIIHALYPEIPIKFVENASAGLSEEDHAAACRIMKDCQIEVVSI